MNPHFNNLEFILASKSPRRQYLLKAIGINFKVHTREVDESFPDFLRGEEIPIFLCEKKASAFDLVLEKNTVVITADTIVWVDNQVLNKPVDRDDATRMLRMLSGKKHEVFTGVCIRAEFNTSTFVTRSTVVFNELSDELISNYIDNCSPFDKAGSYGAQECLPPGMDPCSAADHEFLRSIGREELAGESINANTGLYPVISRIEGSYFNVMGFPIREVYEQLKRF